MRVFAAIEIPREVKARMLDASRYLAFKEVTLVREEALHLTLLFFGEVSEARVREIEAAMDSIGGGGFGVTLHGIGFFKPERIRVVYAGVAAGAERLASMHDYLARRLGVGSGERFVPHATMARVRGLRERAAFMEVAREYEDCDFGSFQADSITLVRSELGYGAPVYEELYKSKL